MIHKVISAKQKSIESKFDPVDQKENAPEGFIRLKNVKILNKYSLVCDENYTPIDSCLNEYLFWQPSVLRLGTDVSGEVARRRMKAQEVAETAPQKNIISLKTYNDYVYLMHTFGWYPYGHLFDTLQRIFPLRNQSLRAPQYLCSDHRRVTDFDKHLEFLGADKRSILSFRSWDVLEVQNLIVGFSPSHVAQFTFDTMNWILDRYMNSLAFQAYCRTRKELGDFVLYLDREGTGRRGVINNSEVKDSLIKGGHTVVTFDGQESLLETMWLFNNAKAVIGGHGAAFINTIFCNRKALILEFCPVNRPYVSILEMPKPSRDHHLILVDADENLNIKIDTGHVEECLRGI